MHLPRARPGVPSSGPSSAQSAGPTAARRPPGEDRKGRVRGNQSGGAGQPLTSPREPLRQLKVKDKKAWLQTRRSRAPRCPPPRLLAKNILAVSSADSFQTQSLPGEAEPSLNAVSDVFTFSPASPQRQEMFAVLFFFFFLFFLPLFSQCGFHL